MIKNSGGQELQKISKERKLIAHRSRAWFVAEAVRDKLIQVKKRLFFIEV
jgi:hypothetical protein